MKRILLCATLAALAHGATANTAADPSATTAALQTLATEVKLALDHPGDKHAPHDVGALHQRFDALAAAANAPADSALAQKYRGVAHLIDKLQFTLEHPAPAGSGAPASLPRLDRESLSATRGTTCANALGVSTALPVEVTLTGPGGGGADAWFRLEPAAAGHIQFSTDSSGADPSLAVYPACGAAPLAQNDDSLGLDAGVDVAVADRSPLYVHVGNSGKGGRVRLSATTADATLTGTVTDAASGQPIAFAQVALFTSDGNWTYPGTGTDSNGHYSLTAPAGQYYLQASAAQHVSGLAPHAQCGYSPYYYSIMNCDKIDAEQITLVSGTTTAGVNASLDIGQRISGYVRTPNNDPVPNATLAILDANGNVLTAANADPYGRYLITAVPNGSYRLRASGGYYNGMFGSQLYSGITCGGPLLNDCDVSQAPAVTIAYQDLIGADFTLTPLSAIHGTVSGPGSTNSFVYVVNQAGGYVTQVFTSYSGAYSAGPLAPGTYYVYATSYGFFPQLYPGVNCGPDCTTSLGSGTPVVIAQTGDMPEADFSLDPLPVQTGHIQDALTNQPLLGVTVYASPQPPATFSGVASAVTNANGDYTLGNLGAGSYYLWAQSPDHIDQVYPSLPCELYLNYSGTATCDVTGAVLETITPTTTTLPPKDFQLQPSSAIDGNISVRGSNAPASSVTLLVFDGSGVEVGGVNPDANGNYSVADLPAGTYFAAAYGSFNNVQYEAQMWQGIDCPNTCVPTQSTPIPLAANSTVGSIDFSLLRRDAIIGQVVDSNNQPLNGVLIDLFDATTLAYVATTATDAQGKYLVAGNLNFSFYVATEAPGNYVDQIYSGVTCPLGPAYQHKCAFTGATPVPLSYAASQPHVVNFTLALPPDEIFMGDFE